MQISERNSILGLIGFSRRAGSIVIGTDLVCDEIRSGKIHFAILAMDCSPNTKKRVLNCCEYYKCDLLTDVFTKEELTKICSKSSYISAIGISDRNIIKGILGKIKNSAKENQEEKYVRKG